jgi:hypothetical protein
VTTRFKEQRPVRSQLIILVFPLLAVLAMSCSKESQLVGDWQATSPQSLHLKITRSNHIGGGFYDGISVIGEGGQSSYVDSPRYFWRLVSLSDGISLQAYYWDPRPVVMMGIELGRKTLPPVEEMTVQWTPHKITELTSDKLVMNWNNATYEFYRSGSAGQIDNQKKADAVAVQEAEQRRVADQRDEKQRLAEERATKERRASIVGTWRDENSTATYSADGSYSIIGEGRFTAKGQWSLEGDYIVVQYSEWRGMPNSGMKKNQILSLTPSAMTIVDGGGTWHSVRLN